MSSGGELLFPRLVHRLHHGVLVRGDAQVLLHTPDHLRFFGRGRAKPLRLRRRRRAGLRHCGECLVRAERGRVSRGFARLCFCAPSHVHWLAHWLHAGFSPLLEQTLALPRRAGRVRAHPWLLRLVSFHWHTHGGPWAHGWSGAELADGSVWLDRRAAPDPQVGGGGAAGGCPRTHLAGHGAAGDGPLPPLLLDEARGAGLGGGGRGAARCPRRWQGLHIRAVRRHFRSADVIYCSPICGRCGVSRQASE
mmetsp:Transcript_60719/g.198802  ORF Transcript_60719/g.198802 Transcript_60719/m.198802 type:complete len:250 (+) Transcript_60719:870-1619(+)